ncbi:MAG TPA: SdrD B-like domain-containing protein [Tepidisphaeraceae bacterium]|jgi:hypothetical protein|nr:SdrD B-like domain-containing protein [Tepidisphaeraceae bacterium]
MSFLESLESRQFFSTVTKIKIPSTDRPHPAKQKIAYTQYQVISKRNGKATPAAGYANPVGKTPAQVRKAYGVDSVSFNDITGTGAGQTIAIIDAYDDPSFVSSTNSNFLISDLHRFDTQFGIADPPSFLKVSQTGSQTSLPAYNSGWSGEIALDVEWSHAMAPDANIVLIEANTSSSTNLNAAIKYAKSLANVSVVTMSYGMTEYATESANDSLYTTPSGHTGITYFSSTGDAGSPGSYQAYSPNVVAVGGTSLYLNSDNSYASEAGWSGSGGGISQYESIPSYQSSIVTQTSTKRATPDVSALANPNTGVAILESSAGGIGSAGGWEQIGGTSLASPLWAGMMAIADQGRTLLGLGTLFGSTQTLPRIYSLSSSDFHDVTTGSNGGFSAGVGYDLVTGRGTPIANQLIPDLAGGATISGTVFADTNANGSQDTGELPLANTTLYLDLNNNGVDDSTEPSVTTSATGSYSFTDLLGHVSYTVREVTPSGDLATTPASVTLSSLSDSTSTANFGLTPSFSTNYTGATITLRLDSTGSQLQLFASTTAIGTPAYTLPKALTPSLNLVGTAANDSLTIDLSNGNPLAGTSISYDGAAGSDTISVLGSSAANTAVFSNTAISLDGSSLSTSNVESESFNGNGGYDTLSIAGSTPVTIAPNQTLQSLSLAANAKAILTTGHNTLYTRSLSVDASSSLDLTNGTLIVDNPNAAVSSVRSLLTTGYDAGLWSGAGIDSSAAANDSLHQTALGYLTAADLGVSTYNGQAVGSSAVIVKYTYYGDATLNGKVDADDLALTDRGRAKGLSSWLYGDFNYDGAVNTADYSLQSQPFTANAPQIA